MLTTSKNNGHIRPGNRRVRDGDLEGLCKVCASIPWEELANATEEKSFDLPGLEVLVDTCRICVFFVACITSLRSPYIRKIYPPFDISSRRVAHQDLPVMTQLILKEVANV